MTKLPALTVISKKTFWKNNFFVGILKVNDKNSMHPDPDPLVRGMVPRIQIRIRIHTKMSWIRNTRENGVSDPHLLQNQILFLTWCGSRSRQIYRTNTVLCIKAQHTVVSAHFPQNVSSVSVNVFSLFVIMSLCLCWSTYWTVELLLTEHIWGFSIRNNLPEARRNGISKGSSWCLHIVNNITFFLS
jgi:hypothetical protein